MNKVHFNKTIFSVWITHTLLLFIILFFFGYTFLTRDHSKPWSEIDHTILVIACVLINTALLFMIYIKLSYWYISLFKSVFIDKNARQIKVTGKKESIVIDKNNIQFIYFRKGKEGLGGVLFAFYAHTTFILKSGKRLHISNLHIDPAEIKELFKASPPIDKMKFPTVDWTAGSAYIKDGVIY